MNKPKLTLVANVFGILVLVFLLVESVGARPLVGERAGGILYVTTPPLAESCASWAEACDLQAALSIAQTGDEIWVAAGIYLPTNKDERTASFALVSDVALYGGFVGTERERDERDWAANPTLLSGDLLGDDDPTDPGSLHDNSYRVVSGENLGDRTRLDGFIITAGNADDSTINTGAGMYLADSNLIACNLIFSDNHAVGAGGGVYISGSELLLVNSALIGNTTDAGGGIYAFESEATLVNVTLYGNTATQGGGIKTISGKLTLTNGILWGNTMGQISGDEANVTYSIVQDGYSGEGNLDADPLFRDAASGNLRLRAGSPAIEAGNTDAVPPEVERELGGKSRFVDFDGSGKAEVDRGAYEANPILYVDLDAAGLNDGSAWADAFIDLQDALAVAGAGNQIWVAEGTYYPTATTDRSISFSMKNDVGIYGGFAGTETTRDESDWEVHPTILSGDIHVKNDASDNCYHVLMNENIDDTAILNGFTISAGNAIGGFSFYQMGGGMLNTSYSSPTLTNVIFSGNWADFGGGIYNLNYSSPILTNVIFSNNLAEYYGGGMENNNNSSPILTNVTFSSNTADRGGGIYNNVSSPILTNVTFSSNSAIYGGGMGNYNNSSPTLTNVTFSSNEGEFKGGGIYNEFSNSPLTNVTIFNNSAEWGGAIYNHESSTTLTNVVIWGNITIEGTHIYNLGSTPYISYSDIQGCGSSDASWKWYCGSDGGHNIDADPLLSPLADNGGFTQTHALESGSLAIDAGSPTVCPTTDQRGVTRPLDGDVDGIAVCDMGAYEVHTIIFVDQDADGLGDGTTWQNAFNDLQAALAIAGAGNQIWVAEGTYYPTNTINRSISFSMKNGVVIYGGFAGTETARDQRDWEAHTTVLSGDIGIPGDKGDNSYHVVISSGVGASSILDGFIITAGNANGGIIDEQFGGGMYNLSFSTLYLYNVTFTNNSAKWGGGGVSNFGNSNPALTNVIFTNNTGENSGGGMYNNRSSPTLTNVSFRYNTTEYGGGIFNDESSNPNLTNVSFDSNSAISGGGMYNTNSSNPKLINITFFCNTATWGGGMSNISSNPSLTNVTFSGNNASVGGAIFNSTSSPELINSIMWGNTPDQISGSGSATISYSIVQGGYGGDGNKDTDPLFRDGPGGDLRLMDESPAIDAGNNAAVPAGVLTDLDGNPRFVDFDGDGTAQVDMGAYEHQGSSNKIFLPLILR